MIERNHFDCDDLVALSKQGGIFVFDVEVFPNYVLFAFRDYYTDRVVCFEARDAERIPAKWLQWMAQNFTLVGFNSIKFDMIVMALAIEGYSIAQLHEAVQMMIVGGIGLKELKATFPHTTLEPKDHVDLIEVCPLDGGLKLYAARLHCHHLQDLPFNPNKTLSATEIAQVREYCLHDCDNTQLLVKELDGALKLRADLGAMYGRDLRSKSDAQLAQEIINTELKKATGNWPKKPDFDKVVGTTFNYDPPAYLKFRSPALQKLLADICSAVLEVGANGHVIVPREIDGRKVVVGGKTYSVGIGGLHSNEQCQALRTGEHRILDRDVTGYYPNMILKNGFAPRQFGADFLTVLQSIVDRRTAAKRSTLPSDAVVAASLKIASNGIFGKMADPWSTIYDPKMMVQTTYTGELSLLMAIESLVREGFEVVSANTDGIVSLVPDDRYEVFTSVFAQWERDTGLETEETEYAGLYSRDVNNYIAVKLDGKTKAKGTYAEFGSALGSLLSKNPEARICQIAAERMITKGVPVEETIRACTDLTKFITVKQARGQGAVKDGVYLGKVVRWYYAIGVRGTIQRAANGNTVATSEGGKPCMILPDTLPTDIDYDRYVDMATRILEDVGFQIRRNSQLTML